MDKTIEIGLRGHAQRFRLDEPAYDHLARYLQAAGTGLQDDDRAEVVGDLEQSIGDRLVARGGAADRLISVADIDAVIDAIGPVDAERGPAAAPPPPSATPPRKRRLRRIREGQQIAGVCTGLADYAEIDVDWVRTIFVLGALVTAGILIVVYIAMAFILPIDATREARS